MSTGRFSPGVPPGTGKIASLILSHPRLSFLPKSEVNKKE
jgi:hypothetical protein